MYLQSDEIIVEGVRVPSNHQFFELQQRTYLVSKRPDKVSIKNNLFTRNIRECNIEIDGFN